MVALGTGEHDKFDRPQRGYTVTELALDRAVNGGKVLVYYCGSYGCWLPETYEEAAESLVDILNGLEEKKCPFTVIRLGAHGCHDNEPADICTSRIAMPTTAKRKRSLT